MKYCVRCGRELPTTLDEYGPDLHAPLCVACWEADETQGVDRATWLAREEAAQAVLVLEAIPDEMRRQWLALVHEEPPWAQQPCVVVPARKEDAVMFISDLGWVGIYNALGVQIFLWRGEDAIEVLVLREFRKQRDMGSAQLIRAVGNEKSVLAVQEWAVTLMTGVTLQEAIKAFRDEFREKG